MAANPYSDEVMPYSIRISARHLSLTQTKLSLTRLPHEAPLPALTSTVSGSTTYDDDVAREQQEWGRGVPKRELEPLLDEWLEAYNVDALQKRLNDRLPQYRTNLSGARVHFVHLHGSEKYDRGTPVLYVSSWPAGFAELEPMLPYLTSAKLAVVAPSWPGLGGGFSDALQTAPTSPAAYFNTLATLWDNLMSRLGYSHYVAAGGGEWAFPVLDALSKLHTSGCIGVHISHARIAKPSLAEFPRIWWRERLARVMAVFRPKTENLGWTPAELASKPAVAAAMQMQLPLPITGLENSQTLAYALTDSPVGMLALVRQYLQRYAAPPSSTRLLIDGGRESEPFFLAKSEIVGLSLLAWLPGAEGVLALGSLLGTREKEKGVLKKEHHKKQKAVLMGVSEYAGGLGCPVEWVGTLGEVVWKKRYDRRGLRPWIRAPEEQEILQEEEAKQQQEEEEEEEEDLTDELPHEIHELPSPSSPAPNSDRRERGRMARIPEEDEHSLHLFDSAPTTPTGNASPHTIRRKPLPSHPSLSTLIADLEDGERVDGSASTVCDVDQDDATAAAAAAGTKKRPEVPWEPTGVDTGTSYSLSCSSLSSTSTSRGVTNAKRTSTSTTASSHRQQLRNREKEEVLEKRRYYPPFQFPALYVHDLAEFVDVVIERIGGVGRGIDGEQEEERDMEDEIEALRSVIVG